MPSITLTDPVTLTTVASGLIATNNANLRALLNAGLDAANLKGNPPLGANDVPVWDGTQFVRPTGTANSTTFLRGDGSWQVISQAITQILDFTVSGSSVSSLDSNTILSGNIPQTSTNLLMIFRGVTDQASAQTVSLRFNNDSGANYYYSFVQGLGTTGTAPAYTGASAQTVANAAVASPAANMPAMTNLMIQCYRDTSPNGKAFTYQSTFWDTGSGIPATRNGSGMYLSGANPITRIQIIPGAGNINVGSRWTLYGIT